MNRQPGIVRRRRVPEVLQTSAMDCGPATLKALLGGCGIEVDYTKLRELCLTEVDGTSIDTIEQVARDFGLDARQVLVPLDHFDAVEELLPAILVTRLPSGENHFVLAWRSRPGGAVEIMDPDGGRRLVSRRSLRQIAYQHHATMPTAKWCTWAGKPVFLDPLAARLGRLGASTAAGKERTGAAARASGWRSLAALDATVRMVETMVRAGAVRRGAAALRLVDALWAKARTPHGGMAIPTDCWDVRPAAPGEEPALVAVRGAVMVRVFGRAGAASTPAAATSATEPRRSDLVERMRPGPAAGAHWRRALFEQGVAPIALLTGALLVAATAVTMQAVLLRGLLDVATSLVLPSQRLVALLLVIVFVLAAAAIEIPLALAMLRLGRRIEGRLRIALQEKLARVTDQALQGRPTSDLAERAHALATLRSGVGLLGRAGRSVFQLTLTAAGLAWLDPGCWLPLLVTLAAVLVLPLTSQRMLAERELRTRTLRGTLAKFYLDALCGLLPARAHGAGGALRRAHEQLTSSWVRAGRSLLSGTVIAGALQGGVGLLLVAWLIGDHIARVDDAGGLLLFTYWAIGLLALGDELVNTAVQFPGLRNTERRVLETLSAGEETTPAPASGRATPSATHQADATTMRTEAHLRAAGSAGQIGLEPPASVPFAAPTPAAAGVAIEFDQVAVAVGGQRLLAAVSLTIAAGEHVAIVGRSGAGKSTLLGLLLGWHRCAEGTLRVDGAELDGAQLAALRRTIAWVDPTVRLWNQSLLDNVQYGAAGDLAAVGRAIRAADLLDLAERLPEGLQTSIGEAGGSLSGGEGQRVRHARALLRNGVRLAILDEPFRGLDRKQRTAFVARARDHWRDATMLCVTHDLQATLAFDRVIVVENGRVIETGTPATLRNQPGSRYAALLHDEAQSHAEIWGDPAWRRLSVTDGRVHEAGRLPPIGGDR